MTYLQSEEGISVQKYHQFIEKLVMGDPKTCVYQFICNEKDSVNKYIKEILLFMNFYYISR